MSRIFLNKEENMIFFHGVLTLVFLFFCSGCGKKKDTNLAQTYFKMAFCDLADSAKTHGAYQAALQHINQALVLEKKPEFLALKGTLLMHLGHLHLSESCFKEALLLPTTEDGLHEQILNNYACLLAQLGKTEDASRIWRDLASSPVYNTPEVAWVNIGKLELSAEHFGKAANAFTTAAMLEPQYVDAHFYCAVAACAAGKNRQADEALKKVLQLEPSHQLARSMANLLLQEA
jgi:Tfp pilus assembly protein PilF